jgi:DNA recombination protein RmuC
MEGMDMNISNLLLVAGFGIAGFVIGLLLGRFRTQREILTLTADNAALKQANQTSSEMLRQQKTDFDRLREESRLVFEETASQILQQKSKAFAEGSKEGLGAILSPLGLQIKDFKDRLDALHSEQTSQKAQLIEKVESLQKQTESISAEANNLATALKSNNKTQGDWGERILEVMLEQAGFRKDIHYRVQQVLRTEDEGDKRPDVIINLPDNRCVVIDSKVSLLYYEQWSSAGTEEERQLALKAHLGAIKAQFDDLSKKFYQGSKHLEQTVDFVIMFIPVEPAYILAMKEGAGLWDEAYKKKVIMVSPTNLFAVIKLVDDLWNRDKQDKHVREIVDLAGKLYEKLISALNKLDTLGKRISSVQDAYDDSVKALKTGRGNVVKRALELNEMAGKIGMGQVPQRFLPDDGEDYEIEAPPPPLQLGEGTEES